jgi:pimeloyl-ACP methyl ester carboxylesterase
MRSILRAAAQDAAASTRMVWLPGAFHSPEDFLQAGFDAQVRSRRLPLDLVFVDAQLEHLGDRSVHERLRRDILAPARARGCRSIWLAGISLGGFIALDYAASHPHDWEGLCLLAPYLGNRMLIAEIAGAPGLAAWQPGPLADCDEERRIWRFIDAQRSDSRRMYLGYGREDRFAPAHALMAEALPANAVHAVPGGHDWRTWIALWEYFLDTTFP